MTQLGELITQEQHQPPKNSAAQGSGTAWVWGGGTGCCVDCGTCAYPEVPVEGMSVLDKWPGHWVIQGGQCLELMALLVKLVGDFWVTTCWSSLGVWEHGEVILNLRPNSHQTYAADPNDSSFSPSQPGAISDSFSFSFPLAFVTLFWGFPLRGEFIQPLPSLHLAFHHASVRLLFRMLRSNHPFHHLSSCFALHFCSLEAHKLSALTVPIAHCK